MNAMEKQFEHSIQTIAARVSQLNPAQSEKAIIAGEQLIDQLHAKISNVDKTVKDYAQRQMRTYEFRGKSVSPEEMAREVLEQADLHQWFDDELPENSEISVTDEEIAAVRQSRKQVGINISYVAPQYQRLMSFQLGWICWRYTAT